MKISQTEMTAALKKLREELNSQGYVQAVMAIDDVLSSPATVGRLATILSETWSQPKPPSIREIVRTPAAEPRSFGDDA